MKKILIAALLFTACTKEKQMPPTCGTVIQMKKIYNNTTEWRYLKTDTVKNFGYQCGQFFADAYSQRFDTVQLCFEPVILYWIIY